MLYFIATLKWAISYWRFLTLDSIYRAIFKANNKMVFFIVKYGKRVRMVDHTNSTQPYTHPWCCKVGIPVTDELSLFVFLRLPEDFFGRLPLGSCGLTGGGVDATGSPSKSLTIFVLLLMPAAGDVPMTARDGVSSWSFLTFFDFFFSVFSFDLNDYTQRCWTETFISTHPTSIWHIPCTEEAFLGLRTTTA